MTRYEIIWVFIQIIYSRGKTSHQQIFTRNITLFSRSTISRKNNLKSSTIKRPKRGGISFLIQNCRKASKKATNGNSPDGALIPPRNTFLRRRTEKSAFSIENKIYRGGCTASEPVKRGVRTVLTSAHSPDRSVDSVDFMYCVRTSYTSCIRPRTRIVLAPGALLRIYGGA